MNSTLRSLVFWMVMAVIAVLVWRFSTKFQTSRESHQLQRVHDRRRQRAGRHGHHDRQRDYRRRKDGETFRSYAPPQYEGLANELIDKGVDVTAREADGEPVGGAAL